MTPTDPPRPTLMARLVRLWRATKTCAVVLFVLWNLFFLVLRNPLDVWWDDYLKKWCESHDWWPSVRGPFRKADNATYYYGNFFGIDQGWTMFTPELARRAPF